MKLNGLIAGNGLVKWTALLPVVLAALVWHGHAQTSQDFANGNLVQFDDNGIWTWYSDERAVADVAGGKLVVGCVENATGLGGIPRDGNINVSIFDMQAMTGPRWTLRTNLTSFGGGDDHNAPGLLVMPNGHYLALYTGHNQDSNTWYRTYDPATASWAPEGVFDWSIQPGGTDFKTTYSNPNNMTAEGRTYNFARSNGGGSPNSMISTDYGTNWSYGGELTFGTISGYVQGYFKYWGNGVDRIDFICTEEHPRNFPTSIYSGYVSNAMSFKTDGTLQDANILDKSAMPTPNSFTLVFTNSTVMPPGQTNYRCWNDDVCRYADGTIECIISARINNNVGTGSSDESINPNHAFFFCRYDGTKWTPTYLCQAGFKLYPAEGDYVGLGCLNPSDPNTIYISTKYDPRAVIPGVTDTNLQYSAAHEIWKGVTTNHGATFTWTPITQNSMRDNLRPIMPAWDNNNSALLWFRGSYAAAQMVDGAVLGIVEHRSEVVGQMHYVDATTNNTFLTDGSPLILSPSANQWHLQTGAGNGGTLMSSADTVAETPPAIMTRATVPGPGTYDVWVNFWGTGTTNADWRVQAGLILTNMQVYRSEKCQQVQAWAQDTALVLTNTSPTTNYLYQAYLGRVTASSSNTLSALVAGQPLQTGTNSFNVGDTCRTWYDGISYAKVDPLQIQKVLHNGPFSVTLTWNSVPDQLALTRPTYTVWKKNLLTDPNWTMLATGLPSGGYITSYTDNPLASSGSAFYRVSRP
jgi:hypothetical protein